MAVQFGLLSMRGTVMLIYFGILLVAALIDWDTQIIYDRFHIFILILAIANIWLVPEHGLMDRLIGALIISVPMLLLALVIPGAFGGGDIKLMAVSGAFLGTGPVVCAMFFGLLTGGAYGAFMLKSKKLGKKMYLHSDHFLHSDWRWRHYMETRLLHGICIFYKESNGQLLKR